MTSRSRSWLVCVAVVLAVAGVPAAAISGAGGQQSINSLVTDARSELERMNEFGRLESQSRQLIKEGRFGEARQVAMRALDLNVSNRRAKLLLADIDTAEKAAAPESPPPGREPAVSRPAVSRPAVGGTVPGPERLRPLPEAAGRNQRVVRDIVRAYLTGDYAAAVSASASAGDQAAPRIWLYAACSEAALGLLDKATAEAHFARARELYARAQASGLAFTADRQVISPRIWDVLSKP